MRNSNSRTDQSRVFGEGSLAPAGSLRSAVAQASRVRRRGLLCCALAAAAVPLVSSAVEKDWKTNIGSGNWTLANNWQQLIIPLAGDDAWIANNDAINRVITYDYAGLPITLATLRMENIGTGTNTLTQAIFCI